VNANIAIDANWRWLHTVQGSTNCYNGNEWDESICTSETTCAEQCCVEGADYSGTYGINASGDQLSLKFVTQGTYGKNVGSRTYLMNGENSYQGFDLLNNEFTFDVDVSNIGCGLNGALYFVSMDLDGGISKYSGNKAGAKYGTGYCDAQCPLDIKFINGLANIEGWNPSDSDPNAGVGHYGTCCSEMDIWEANNMATAFTPHPCTVPDQAICYGDECGGTYSSDRYGGWCDADGCDFNSYRQGNTSFYGKGKIVDTTKKITVVTQFLTDSAGDLTEIKRFYAQNGKVIPNSESTIAGVPGNSITDAYCDAQKEVFGDPNIHKEFGGLKQMGVAMKKPMVLVMSIWNDHHANMLWLDSTYPVDRTGPGAARGECPTTSGVPSEVEEQFPNSNVVFSNIRFGPIGSTVPGVGNSNPPVNPPTSTTTSRVTTTQGGSPTGIPQWQQCGGNNWTGGTVCQSPFTCRVINEWYHQCQ